MPIYIS